MEEDNKWTGGERKTDGKAQFLSFSPLVFSPSCWLILNQSLSILSWTGWVKVDEEEVEEVKILHRNFAKFFNGIAAGMIQPPAINHSIRRSSSAGAWQYRKPFHSRFIRSVIRYGWYTYAGMNDSCETDKKEKGIGMINCQGSCP